MTALWGGGGEREWGEEELGYLLGGRERLGRVRGKTNSGVGKWAKHFSDFFLFFFLCVYFYSCFFSFSFLFFFFRAFEIHVIAIVLKSTILFSLVYFFLYTPILTVHFFLPSLLILLATLPASLKSPACILISSLHSLFPYISLFSYITLTSTAPTSSLTMDYYPDSTDNYFKETEMQFSLRKTTLKKHAITTRKASKLAEL